jgi:hypothetical protein
MPGLGIPLGPQWVLLQPLLPLVVQEFDQRQLAQG